MAEPEILVEDAARVRTVTFNRPERLNAVTLESYRALAGALLAADRDPSISVVLLRGSGRAFCSGADLRAPAGTDPEEIGAAFEHLIQTLAGFGKPLVAAVHGPAIGFGMTVLLHCDLVLVAEDARLRTPFVELGTCPEAGSSWLLPRQIGPQAAADMLLTGRELSGAEAVRLGLAARCCPAEELADQARAVVDGLAGMPLAPLVAAKRLIREGRADAVLAGLRRELAAAHELRAEFGFPGAGRGR